MKFHEYQTLQENVASTRPLAKKEATEDFYLRMRNARFSFFEHPHYAAVRCEIERNWLRNVRPYYKCFAFVLERLGHIHLDTEWECLCDGIGRMLRNPLLVRFPAGRKAVSLHGSDACFTSILLNVFRANSGDCCYLAALCQIDGGNTFLYTHKCFDENGFVGKTPAECLQQIPVCKCCGISTAKSVYEFAIRLSLLANDPSIIQPDVLAADRERFDSSTDPKLRQRLIDKARKRGVVGWRIGEQYETIPHFRRPHPAMYHVGKGRADTRIVFRAGAVVHRQKLTTVPTGYLEEDGTEVE